MTQTLHHSPPLRLRIQRQIRSAVVPIILPVNRTAWSLGFLFSVPDSLVLKKLFFSFRNNSFGFLRECDLGSSH